MREAMQNKDIRQACWITPTLRKRRQHSPSLSHSPFLPLSLFFSPLELHFKYGECQRTTATGDVWLLVLLLLMANRIDNPTGQRTTVPCPRIGRGEEHMPERIRMQDTVVAYRALGDNIVSIYDWEIVVHSVATPHGSGT